MIEKGRHMGLDRWDRFCPFCTFQVDTEYHFLMSCPMYENLREDRIIPHLNDKSYDSFVKFLKTNDKSSLYDVSYFVYHAFNLREKRLQNVL